MNSLTRDQKNKLLLGDHKESKIYIRDPIDGGTILRNESRDVIFNWCFDNCQGKFWIGMGFGNFELESDATLFKLRWLS